MLELTEAAGSQLHQSLAANQIAAREQKCFRVIPKDDQQLTLTLAKPAPSDSTFEHDGTVVLAVPKALQPFFEDKSLDIDDDGRLKLM